MSKQKLYTSEAWLRRKYLVEKLDPAKIAALCGTTQMTIYRYIDKFGFRR